jgi:5-methylcytosine-specific restriction endonuclease McrBC regulatory subunit McrC
LEGARASSLKPNITLAKDEKYYILDTKWKVLKSPKPAYQDLQQMYAYTTYFISSHTTLLYPGSEDKMYNGFFFHEENNVKNYPCSVGIIGLRARHSIAVWEKKIGENVRKYLSQTNV